MVDSDSKTWAKTDGTGGQVSVWGISGLKGQILALAGTIVLLVGAPAFIMFVCVVLCSVGSGVEGMVEFVSFVSKKGFSSVNDMYPRPSKEAWTVLAVFGVIQALLQLMVPGKTVYGPITPKGNVPVYKANGVQCFAITLLLFCLGWYLDVFSPARIYDIFGEILAALNIFAFGLCAFLYVKGNLAPSSTDSGTTNSIIYDIYWGMELYPRIGRHFDIKTWTNCRMGMMSWPVLILCFAAKQYEIYGHVADSMIVSVALMEIYVFKFFLWEAGYWSSIDIAHDRAGYYLCWGCLNWVPGIYTSPALYLTRNPVQLGTILAPLMFLAGALCIFINYDADRQRQEFRKKEGNMTIWGKPPKKITAIYFTAKGEKKTSLLLASGWWGISRHFHYIPEILGAFFWTLPGLFDNGLQFFYVFFLTLLLMDRAYRDDKRCGSKYGDYWKEYCNLVPFKLVPGVF